MPPCVFPMRGIQSGGEWRQQSTRMLDRDSGFVKHWGFTGSDTTFLEQSETDCVGNFNQTVWMACSWTA